jgi:hypothetical protein
VRESVFGTAEWVISEPLEKHCLGRDHFFFLETEVEFDFFLDHAAEIWTLDCS